MEIILKKFVEAKNKKSDINEHLDTLLEYAKECNHITEMGVRAVVSTWAFLASNPSKMVSYDIKYHGKVGELLEVVKKESINFIFIEKDVLKVDIETTDLLFIDTLHNYGQLIQELNKHAVKVRKYIIMHDTTTFGNKDELVTGVANKDTNKIGLKAAIEEFLNQTAEGSNWYTEKVYTNNNGLTILKRK